MFWDRGDTDTRPRSRASERDSRRRSTRDTSPDTTRECTCTPANGRAGVNVRGQNVGLCRRGGEASHHLVFVFRHVRFEFEVIVESFGTVLTVVVSIDDDMLC